MILIAYFTTIISLIIGAAHFMREGNSGLMVFLLLLPFSYFLKKRFILHIIAGVLFLLAVEWAITAVRLYEIRLMLNEPATRMLIIMSSVALFTVLSGFLLYSQSMLLKYPK